MKDHSHIIVIAGPNGAGKSTTAPLYQPLTESWYFYDNSIAGSPNIIASGSKRGGIYIERPEIWVQIEEVYGGGRKG